MRHIRFNCLTAPTDRCRLIVRATDGLFGRRLGALRASVPRGKSRRLYVPVSRRSAARIRRGTLDPAFLFTLIDPDGRRRVDFAL
jgi:hypothetical protein